MEKIIIGLMRCCSLNFDDFEKLILKLLDKGLNYFDLADIYNNGKSEEYMGRFLKNHPDLRSKMIIQTKVGIIIDVGYDLSKDYIINAVNNCLKRLNTNYVDNLLLHRPDVFFDNKEVAGAINYLLDNKIIKNFGVSNFSKEMIIYLDKYLNKPIKINQLQLGLGHLNLISEGLNFNINNKDGTSTTSDTYYFMKNNDIELQCWSPFQYGFLEGSIFDEKKFPELNKALEELSIKYKTNKSGIATSFLSSIWSKIYIVTGSMNYDHIIDSYNGSKIKLSKKDWFYLYKKANYILP